MLFGGQHYSMLNKDSAELYRLTDDDVNNLHNVLLDMYKDINSVCESTGIHLIAAGGTALGAVRHHGFIPWDDDMDLFMFRADFEKFKIIFERELNDKYYLLYPGSTKGSNCFLPRIMKKGTTLLGMIDETAPYPHGVYIDINIIEYVPNNKFKQLRKGLGSDFRRFVSYSVYWQQYKSTSLKQFMLSSKKGAIYYRLRMVIGKLFSYKSAEEWFASFDKYVQSPKSNILTIPTGTKKYFGERIHVKKVKPLKKLRFEDTQIYVFNNYDWYLSHLYGDYMTIPSENNREGHLCIKLDFKSE